MRNYDKVLQNMNLERAAKMLENEDWCCESYTSADDYECHSPEGLSCFDCIKEWLEKECD